MIEQPAFPEMPPKVLSAFQLYLFNHSFAETAREVGVSRTTVFNWARKYKWREREKEALRRIQRDIEAYRRDVKEDQRKIIRAVIAKAVGKIRDGDLEIDNVHELLAVLKYQLELEGESFSDINVEVNAILPIAELVSEIEDRRLKRVRKDGKIVVEGRVND